MIFFCTDRTRLQIQKIFLSLDFDLDKCKEMKSYHVIEN